MSTTSASNRNVKITYWGAKRALSGERAATGNAETSKKQKLEEDDRGGATGAQGSESLPDVVMDVSGGTVGVVEREEIRRRVGCNKDRRRLRTLADERRMPRARDVQKSPGSRARLWNEPPELDYDWYESYLMLEKDFSDPSTIFHIKGVRGYATEWIDLSSELDLLTDYRGWIGRELQAPELKVSDIPFYLALEEDLALETKEVCSDYAEMGRGPDLSSLRALPSEHTKELLKTVLSMRVSGHDSRRALRDAISAGKTFKRRNRALRSER